MKLRTLLTEAGYEMIPESPYAEIEITSVCHDTRMAEKGSLFVALRGRQTDGHAHIPREIGRAHV